MHKQLNIYCAIVHPSGEHERTEVCIKAKTARQQSNTHTHRIQFLSFLFYWKQVVCDHQFTTKGVSTLPSPSTTHGKFRTMRQIRIKTLYSINHPVLKNKTVKKETLKALNRNELSDDGEEMDVISSDESESPLRRRSTLRDTSASRPLAVGVQWQNSFSELGHGWVRVQLSFEMFVCVCVSGSAHRILFCCRAR